MIVVTGLQIAPIRILYTNYRGETSIRNFRPYNLYWGNNEYHPEPQWLMEGMDEDKKETRTFALKNMRPVPSHIRLFFKGGTYMDVLREEAHKYETQQDYDHTEEIG